MQLPELTKPIRIFRPPTVPAELWDLVPEHDVERLLLYTARQLMGGYHPIVTVKRYLTDAGLMPKPQSVKSSGFKLKSNR